jgi:thioredoxin reductase
MRYDALIIGAGPAGLSAALMLGRCRRSVLVVDANEPRNGAAQALHGYLTQDGVTPGELRDRGRADLRAYPSVQISDTRVLRAQREEGGFQATLETGESCGSRLLLLATGRVDPVPTLPGFREFFGRGVHHCPYCDGWEHRGRPLGVYGSQRGAREIAKLLLTWTDDVTLYLDGATPPRASDGAPPIRTLAAAVSRLEGAGKLERVVLADGSVHRCDALFFCSACTQRSPLPRQLGCQLDEEESVRCTGHRAEGVPGLFVAGNVRGGVHLAITAAAEGAEAAIAMNEELLEKKT